MSSNLNNYCSIIGSRTYTNYTYMAISLDYYFKIHGLPTKLYSGAANGADLLGEKYIKSLKKDIEIIQFKPDYNKYGKSAPLIRDREIVDKIDYLLAFPNDDSKGTFYTINYGLDKMKKIILFFTKDTYTNINNKIENMLSKNKNKTKYSIKIYNNINDTMVSFIKLKPI